MTTPVASPKFIPALRFHWLTRLYDGLINATLKEDAFKGRLIQQANVAPGHRVLDVGCGTGTLTVMLKRAHPAATVIGLDADPAALAIAKKKAQDGHVEIEFRQGLASAPPFEPGTFDRIVSSLVFHHLATADKRLALAAARSLLRTGGELHIADWGRAENVVMRAAFLGVQLLDGFATTTDNVQGCLPRFIEQAGFSSVTETHREMTVFGTLSLHRAVVR